MKSRVARSHSLVLSYRNRLATWTCLSLLISAAGIGLLWEAILASAAFAAGRPNIVLILADDMDYYSSKCSKDAE